MDENLQEVDAIASQIKELHKSNSLLVHSNINM